MSALIRSLIHTYIHTFTHSLALTILYLCSSSIDVYVMCVSELDEVVEFLEEVIAALLADQEVRTFGEVMVPVLDILHGRMKDLDLCQLLLYSYLDILLYFTHQKDIAKVWLNHLKPLLFEAVSPGWI